VHLAGKGFEGPIPTGARQGVTLARLRNVAQFAVLRSLFLIARQPTLRRKRQMRQNNVDDLLEKDRDLADTYQQSSALCGRVAQEPNDLTEKIS
jgi:hypothetical protein